MSNSRERYQAVDSRASQSLFQRVFPTAVASKNQITQRWDHEEARGGCPPLHLASPLGYRGVEPEAEQARGRRQAAGPQSRKAERLAPAPTAEQRGWSVAMIRVLVRVLSLLLAPQLLGSAPGLLVSLRDSSAGTHC